MGSMEVSGLTDYLPLPYVNIITTYIIIIIIVT